MKEVNPKETNRAVSYEYFIDAQMPMVTIFKTIDITNVVNVSKKGYKFNMLLCYCIVKAATLIPEFKLLPIGKQLFEYDKLGINVIISNKYGHLSFCDLPYHQDIDTFNQDYLRLTKQVYETCENYEIQDTMIVGTSALVKYDFDGVVNMYSGKLNNPFLAWGKYMVKDSKKLLKLSFQFHHVQMDGEQACMFLDELQNQIQRL
jgi:chloramphenicol O-acetyltransferase type A